MAENLVINGVTYPDVESLELNTADGKKVLYFEGQPVEVAQETGSDETAVMSQAAVTNALNTLSNEKVDQNQGAENVGKILAVGTDGNLVLVPMPEGGVAGDVVGSVDESNNILLTGDLADGTYSIKYEMEDGSIVNIGSLVVSGITYVTVTNNLTNCTNSNSATQAVKGESYSATITAVSGYELSSVEVTMGGSPVTVSGGTISIAEVTGNIVITAVAEEKQAAEPVTVDITLTNGIRLGSDGTDRTAAGCCATPYIDLTNVPKPCTINLTKAAWCNNDSYNSGYVRCYAKKADGTALVSDTTREDVGGNYFTVVCNGGSVGDVTITVTSDDVGYIRFSAVWTAVGYSDSTANFAAANTKATLTYTPES